MTNGRARRERVGAFFAAHATHLLGSVRAVARAPGDPRGLAARLDRA